jgi:proline dehydrogenase
MALIDRVIASSLPYIPKPLVRRVANRYIAGETVEDAMRVARRLNRNGFRTTMDILGEDIRNLDQARAAAGGYLRLLDEIHQRRIDSNVSIKLTQFGLKLDKACCVALTASVVQKAKERDNFVRIDMEDSSCTSDTFDIYRTLRENYSNVGVVIQAYLKRTLDDTDRLDDLEPNYRLCKGVYVEPPEIAYRDMRDITRNYQLILEQLLRRGRYVGIATHDESIVREATRLIRELRLPGTAYEFQMLLGVSEQLRNRIQSAGHPLRIYIPFGKDWYAYSVRRMRENPRIAGYVLKALFAPK